MFRCKSSFKRVFSQLSGWTCSRRMRKYWERNSIFKELGDCGNHYFMYDELCTNTNVWPMRTGFPASLPQRRWRESLVIPRHEWLNSTVVKKNSLSVVWPGISKLLWPQAASYSRSLVRRHAGISGDRITSRELSKMQESETGTICFSGRQSILHETFCHVCW